MQKWLKGVSVSATLTLTFFESLYGNPDGKANCKDGYADCCKVCDV